MGWTLRFADEADILRELTNKHPELLTGGKKENEERLQAVERGFEVRRPSAVPLAALGVW